MNRDEINKLATACIRAAAPAAGIDCVTVVVVADVDTGRIAVAASKPGIPGEPPLSASETARLLYLAAHQTAESKEVARGAMSLNGEEIPSPQPVKA